MCRVFGFRPLRCLLGLAKVKTQILCTRDHAHAIFDGNALSENFNGVLMISLLRNFIKNHNGSNVQSIGVSSSPWPIRPVKGQNPNTLHTGFCVGVGVGCDECGLVSWEKI